MCVKAMNYEMAAAFVFLFFNSTNYYCPKKCLVRRCDNQKLELKISGLFLRPCHYKMVKIETQNTRMLENYTTMHGTQKQNGLAQ